MAATMLTFRSWRRTAKFWLSAIMFCISQSYVLQRGLRCSTEFHLAWIQICLAFCLCLLATLYMHNYRKSLLFCTNKPPLS